MRMETVFTIKLLKIAGWQLFDQGEIGEWTNCAWVCQSLRVGQTCGKHVVRFECQENILLCLAWRRLPHQTFPRAPSLRVVARDGLRIGDGANPEKRLGKRSGRRRAHQGRGPASEQPGLWFGHQIQPRRFRYPAKIERHGGGTSRSQVELHRNPMGFATDETSVRRGEWRITPRQHGPDKTRHHSGPTGSSTALRWVKRGVISGVLGAGALREPPGPTRADAAQGEALCAGDNRGE